MPDPTHAPEHHPDLEALRRDVLSDVSAELHDWRPLRAPGAAAAAPPPAPGVAEQLAEGAIRLAIDQLVATFGDRAAAVVTANRDRVRRVLSDSAIEYASSILASLQGLGS